MRLSRLALVLAAALLLAPASANAGTFTGASASDDAQNDVRQDIDGLPLPDVRTVETSYDDAAGRITVAFRFWQPIVVPGPPGEVGPIPFYVEQFTGGVTLGVGDGGPGGWTCSQAGGLRLGFTYSASWGGGFPPFWDIAAEASGDAYPARPASVELGADELVLTYEDAALAGRSYACVTDVSLDQDLAAPFDFTGFPPLGSLSISTPLSLDAASYRAGDTIRAAVEWTGAGGITALRGAAITALPPGSTGPGMDFSATSPPRLVADGDTLWVAGTFALPADAPAGTWQVLARWQDATGVWHDGPAQAVEIAAAPPPVPTPTPSPQPPAAAPPATGTARPPLDVLAPRVATLIRSTRISALRRGRLRVTVVTDETARIALQLLRGRTLIARGSAAVSVAGRATITLRLTRAGRRALRRLRRGSFQLRGVVTDAAGNQSTIARRIALR